MSFVKKKKKQILIFKLLQKNKLHGTENNELQNLQYKTICNIMFVPIF